MFEAIFSGRHDNQIVEGYPFLDRDPVVFERILDIIRSYPLNEYTPLHFGKENIEELSFLGIDYEESNRKFLQALFNTNPIPGYNSYKDQFIPIDICDGSFPDIDHSLYF